MAWPLDFRKWLSRELSEALRGAFTLGPLSCLSPEAFLALEAFVKALVVVGGVCEALSLDIHEIMRLAAGPKYAFTREGDFRRLTFEGKTTHIENGVEPKFIALLLANPGKELFCPDILALANGNPIVKTSQAKYPLADDAAIREYKRRLRELTNELEEVKEFNDWGKQETLQCRLDALKEYVLKLRGLHGKSRTFSGTFDNARTSVTNAINRTLTRDAIMKKLPEAYRPLDNSISRGRAPGRRGPRRASRVHLPEVRSERLERPGRRGDADGAKSKERPR